MQLILAYLAGLIDGEGYVGIKRSRAYSCQGRKTKSYHARIQVRMVDREGVVLLAETFGGHLFTEKPHCNNGRPLHCWSTSDRQAELALTALLPYLRVKRRQAKKVLVLRRLQGRSRRHRTKITGYRDFPNQYGTVRRVANKAFSDEYVAWCDRLWMDCRLMNGLARQAAAA